MIKTRKIGIIGTGHVGSHVAFSLATQGEVDELILIDKDQNKAIAQALDLMDATSYYPHHLLAKAGTYSDLKEADILVISAGPLPDMFQDRLDTLNDTITVLKEILPQIKTSGFSGIILSISNPADVVATYIQKFLNYPKNKILSTGCVLDSARLQSRLSQTLDVNRKSLIAYCMGEHGSSAMVSWSNVFVGALPLADFLRLRNLSSFDTDQLLSETKEGGYLVLRGKGSTEFGIAASLVEIVRCIFHNEHKILPASVYLDGEYQQSGIFASVPSIIGKNGVEQILEIKLTQQEQEAFTHSCSVIKQNYEKALIL
ncbi:L-lactate dehydrogenase [Vagococcus entomophilus]|uniref:L-lactate dehydrogenase n=1 Tax=Vagococcus entomophilus TaxID=1160095 RepID=A0A430AKX5_9ENTE|nr:L-lactate dehydrogenase [Vagococcus entomophilus]RSU08614.1 L-lactate dehydrogenase [Vagococcus entomophilus]